MKLGQPKNPKPLAKVPSRIGSNRHPNRQSTVVFPARLAPVRKKSK